MNFDNEESKDFEKKFAGYVEQLKQLTPERIQQIRKSALDLKKIVAPLMKKETRTEDEEEILQKATEVIKKLMTGISDTMLILDEKNLRNSKFIHEHLKKSAAEGDATAIKALKELDPAYRKMLEEQIGKN